MRHEKDRGGGCVEGVDEQAELNRRFAVEVLGWTYRVPHRERLREVFIREWFGVGGEHAAWDLELSFCRSLTAAWPGVEKLIASGTIDGVFLGDEFCELYRDREQIHAVYDIEYPAEALVRACLEATKP